MSALLLRSSGVKVLQMNRQVLLLAIVGALLFARFVWVPLNESRVEKQDIYTTKHAQFYKGEILLAQKNDIENALAEQNAKLEKYESIYPNADSTFAAQLKMQQNIQVVALDKKVQLDEVEWISTIPGNPEKALLELNFSANLKDLMYFFTEVEQLGPWISITQMQYRVDKQRVNWKRLGDAKGKMTLEVFYLNTGDK